MLKKLLSGVLEEKTLFGKDSRGKRSMYLRRARGKKPLSPEESSTLYGEKLLEQEEGLLFASARGKKDSSF